MNIQYEVLSEMTRPKTKNRRTPWQWQGQIIISGLDQTKRVRMGLPVNSSQYEIIPVEGVVEAKGTQAEIRERIAGVFKAKVDELKQLAKEPSSETKKLPTNQIVKDKLTVIEDLP